MQKSLRTLTALAACVFTVLTPALAAAAPAATQGSSVLDLNLPALAALAVKHSRRLMNIGSAPS